MAEEASKRMNEGISEMKQTLSETKDKLEH